MKARLAALLIGLTVAASGAARGGSGVEERIQRIANGLLPSVMIEGQAAEMKLADRMRSYKTPGVSIAVIHEGRIDWARGFGVVEAGGSRPVTDETLFQAGSISKPVAALAALRLVERGELSLDEDVNAKLKSWKLLYPESETRFFMLTDNLSVSFVKDDEGRAGKMMLHFGGGAREARRVP